ncbi:MAG: hypothetical protein NTX65_16120 [Ignavibacteriales bacterium]|nr:hypothetical protein [Ignavibacteriales bacterium]
MEMWQVCFNNAKGLKIKAKKKDLLKVDQRFIAVKMAESDLDENILINLDNVLWLMKVNEKENETLD